MTTARGRRKQSMPKRDVQLYEIPMSVLDLDAENNTQVRPYDEAMEAEETTKWRAAHASIDALAERLAAVSREVDAAEARMRATAEAPGPWRVSDRDVWSVALRGVPGTKMAAREQGREQDTTHEPSLISELLFRNGISARTATDGGKTIPFLLHRQRIAAKHDLATGAALRQALVACRDLVEVRRLLVQAMRTATGRAVVADESAAVAARLQSFLDDQGTTALAALAEQTSTLLLNLRFSFASQGAPELPPTLCSLGLRAAAAAGEPGAMQRFLEIGLTARYYPENSSVLLSGQPVSAVLSALSTIHAGLQAHDTAASAYEGKRAELFSLLTGESLVGAPSSPAEEVSFRAALGLRAHDGSSPVAPGVRALYRAVLGGLGGVRTLWEEQQQHSAAGAAGSEGSVDADTLATGVLRYAAYVAGAQRLGAAGVCPTGQGSLLDLQTIHAYETASARAKQAPSVLQTLRLAATAPPSATARAIAHVDDAFRAQVVAAYAMPTADEAMGAIDALIKSRKA